MNEDDELLEAIELRENVAALCEHLTHDECCRLKREIVRYANQDSTVLPQGFVQLVQVARARGFRPI